MDSFSRKHKAIDAVMKSDLDYIRSIQKKIKEKTTSRLPISE